MNTLVTTLRELFEANHGDFTITNDELTVALLKGFHNSGVAVRSNSLILSQRDIVAVVHSAYNVLFQCHFR